MLFVNERRNFDAFTATVLEVLFYELRFTRYVVLMCQFRNRFLFCIDVLLIGVL